MCALLLMWAGCLLLPGAAGAATWHVSPDGTGDFPDIQSAVAAASGGDEILLDDGVFTGPGNRYVDLLGKAVTVRSASGNAAACIIEAVPPFRGWLFACTSGEGPSTVIADVTLDTGPLCCGTGVRVSGASPTLRGVTIRADNAVWSNGGAPRLESSFLEDGSNVVCQFGASAVLTGCVLEAGSRINSRGRVRVFNSSIRFENSTERQGGFLLSGSSAEIVGCDVAHGLVMSLGDGASVLVEDCTLSESGVLLQGDGSTLVVRNSVIRGGLAQGIQVSGTSQATIEGCEVRGFSSTGVSLSGGDGELRGCLITGNRYGLSLFGAGTTVNVDQCTIAANAAPGGAGAGLSLGAGTSATVRGSIIWGNCAASAAAAWVDAATLTLDCVTVDPALIGGTGTVQVTGDIVNADPLFCDPIACGAPSADGDFTLQEGSPALSAACGVMGGQGQGCGAVSVEAVSWGSLKGRYR